jgi:acyl-coenzyme A synthetase/AMP-(fatty) acid ligase
MKLLQEDNHIYILVERLKEVDDSLCVACKNKLKEERVVLFIKMANGYK